MTKEAKIELMKVYAETFKPRKKCAVPDFGFKRCLINLLFKK